MRFYLYIKLGGNELTETVHTESSLHEKREIRNLVLLFCKCCHCITYPFMYLHIIKCLINLSCNCFSYYVHRGILSYSKHHGFQVYHLIRVHRYTHRNQDTEHFCHPQGPLCPCVVHLSCSTWQSLGCFLSVQMVLHFI